MRVMHFSWTLEQGGLEKLIYDLARTQKAYGHRATACALSHEGAMAQALKEAGVEVFCLEKKPGLDFTLPFRLRRLLKEQKVDIIHAHNQGAMFYSGLGAMGLCPMIGTRHGTSATGEAFKPDRSYRLLSRLVGRMARFTACVGKDSLRVARDIDHLPKSRLKLVYNGVDTELYSPDPQQREEVRRELGLPPDASLVLGVGRFSPEKAFQHLVEAFARIAEKHPKAYLIIAGDGAEHPMVAARAEEPCLAGRIILPGNRRDIPRLMAASDVFALSSLSEGISLAILEAMATGLPVAATQVGGNAEIVKQGKTGLLTHPSVPRELAITLDMLLGHPERAREMGAEGRRVVEKGFSLEAMHRAYLEIYRQVIDG